MKEEVERILSSTFPQPPEGWARVRKLVEQAGGELRISSTDGERTCLLQVYDNGEKIKCTWE